MKINFLNENLSSHFSLSCNFKMRKLFLIVVVIHSVLGSKSDENCYTKFLQTSEFNENDQTCKNIFKNHTDEFRNDILDRLGPNQNTSCLFGVLNEYKIINMYLRGLAQQSSMKNLTNAKYEEEVEESKDTVMIAAKVLCSVDELYKQSFDEMFEIDENDNDKSESAVRNTTHNELCVQKYMIDNKIIDNEKFTFSTHVKNVTDCQNAHQDIEDLFRDSLAYSTKLSDTFFGLSTVKANECTMEKFKSEKTFSKLYSLKVIMKLELNDEQKELLKKNYVEWTVSSLIFMFECMRFI